MRVFRVAASEYGYPSRICGDYGGENIMVAREMIIHHGADRNSFICGSLRFNTRIERLWRDVRRVVCLLLSECIYLQACMHFIFL